MQPIFPPPSLCRWQNHWRGVSGWFALLAVAVILAGCSSLQPQDFASVGPRFDPQKFFAGHTTSWGIFEDRSGANPSRRFTTDCFGRWENGELVFAQTFTYGDGSSQKRLWHIRKLDEHRYEATASDVVGVARGEAFGNAFHWEYTVALKPGNPLLNVLLKQWMYLQPDGRTMLNRGTVNKFGVTVQQIAEEFRRGN